MVFILLFWEMPNSTGRYRVHQRSIKSSLLDPIYFDDGESRIIDSLIVNFADDKKIAQLVKKASDTQIPLNSIDKFILWYDNNGLCVHIMKCQIITYSMIHWQWIVCLFVFKCVCFSFHWKRYTHYYIKGKPIRRFYTIRDRGALLDSKLTLAEHLEYATNKANVILAFVKRKCYKTFDIDITKMLFHALVCEPASLLEKY